MKHEFHVNSMKKYILLVTYSHMLVFYLSIPYIYFYILTLFVEAYYERL